jgi:Tol biopolymer transport system component
MAVTVALFGAVATAAPSTAPELVSRASGPNGVKADATSSRPQVSANGRFVAFESSATNLHPADTDPELDVYVRDLVADETILVSRTPSGASAEETSEDPAISADGRFVAFASTAGDLVPGRAAGLHVYVHDLQTQTTLRVDRATGTDGPTANNDSGHPAISGDGRFVAFETAATNLDPADGDDAVDVYVRDLGLATTTLVSTTAGSDPRAYAALPAISADGTAVAYRTAVAGLQPAVVTPGGLYVRDLANAVPEVVRLTEVIGEPSISADGSRVAYSTNPSPDQPSAGSRDEVFVHDLEGELTMRASRELRIWGKRRPGKALDPSISADGRYVAFSVQYGQRGGRYALATVLRDLREATSDRLPGARSGTSDSRDRGFEPVLPSLARNADRLAYQSDASRADAGDPDRALDVFALEP